MTRVHFTAMAALALSLVAGTALADDVNRNGGRTDTNNTQENRFNQPNSSPRYVERFPDFFDYGFFPQSGFAARCQNPYAYKHMSKHQRSMCRKLLW